VKQGLIANQDEAFAGKSLEHALAAGDQAGAAHFSIHRPSTMGCQMRRMSSLMLCMAIHLQNQTVLAAGKITGAVRSGPESETTHPPGKGWELACDKSAAFGVQAQRSLPQWTRR
jgi:hypothetical protein